MRRFSGGLGKIKKGYATYFPLTENPISEGGMWVNAGAAGYRDCRSTPGLCFGTGTSPSPPYDDPIALVSGTWRPTQTVEAIVTVPASPSGFQEVELYLLGTIDNTADTMTGYQFLWSVTGNSYMGIYKNTGPNGASSDFPLLVEPGAAQPQMQTGWRIKATVDANGVLTAFRDSLDGAGYVQICQVTDTSFRTGSPGLGFYSTVVSTGFGLSYFVARET